MRGYHGRLLAVDLDRGTVEPVSLSEGYLRQYVGGSGLAARLYLDHIKEGTLRPDPLGGDNPFFVMTGPLTGTGVPAASRFTVAARSPLTGLWGEANVGGFFGPALKGAGYDGIVVTGKSPRPVYLVVEGGRASLEDAGELWGKDAYETDDLLRQRHGGQSLVIGPAGENLVSFAAVVHGKGHIAGRTGMGAVMGAKGLKAIVAKGSDLPQPADPVGLRALVRDMVSRMRENLGVQTFRAVGTLVGMDVGLHIGDVPIKNWSVGAWPGLEDLGSGPYSEQILVGQRSCHACPVACKRVVSAQYGGYRVERAHGPEYETCASFGSLLLIDDLQALACINDLANRLGMDTISCGATLAFALEAKERGLLPEMEGDWGDAAAVIELLRDIAMRRGIGDRLARGSRALSREIPGSEEFLTTVKGLEAPMHDARALHGMALAYATSVRGACHMSGLAYNVESGVAYLPEIGLGEEYDQRSAEGKARMVALSQDLGMVFGGSAVFCQLGAAGFDSGDLAAALHCVTGRQWSAEALLQAGERIWHLKRGLGNLYGLTAEDDRLPERLLRPLEDGPAAGSVPDLDRMLAEFYAIRSLGADGRATREKLAELNLEDLAELLYGGEE